MLRNAVRDAGLSCHVKGDGLAVAIDRHNSRQPDVSIQCSEADPEAMVLDEPLVVVETVSPSSGRSDTGTKVGEYFRVASIQHCLIIDPYGKSIILHSRMEREAGLRTTVHVSGPIRVDPPGFVIDAQTLVEGP